VQGLHHLLVPRIAEQGQGAAAVGKEQNLAVLGQGGSLSRGSKLSLPQVMALQAPTPSILMKTLLTR
jgi:hypothetical protein